MDTFCDLETFSTVPIKDGSHRYLEGADIMLWAYAIGDGPTRVWDLSNHLLWDEDDLSGVWEPQRCADVPADLLGALLSKDVLVWFHNGGMFDFPVLDHCLPELGKMIAPERRRDTMCQAYAHGLPGALEKLGIILRLSDDQKKHADGKRLIQLFCKPQLDDKFQRKHPKAGSRASMKTHPEQWARFVSYAGGDIITMRAIHKQIPMWNYRGAHIDSCLLDWKINNRGFQIDLDHVRAAIAASDRAKAKLALRTVELTDGEVDSTTQRDAMLRWILEAHGVDLPDLTADTLERRMSDPELPDAVKELIGIRLQASMNSVAKYKTVQRAVSADGRLRGGAQWRGAGRTGRWAHRLFQHGNLPRPKLSAELINIGIAAMKDKTEDLIFGGAPTREPDGTIRDLTVQQLCRSAVRGVIVAKPGHKLIVVDLANIEGRKAAWLAYENWKLQAYAAYDTIIPGEFDAKGKPKRKGPDLYVKAYMASFNETDPRSVDKDKRQIGKVQELMFQYGGGVGAWITGAATYGIDLIKMTDAVWETLPEWATDEARQYLQSLYEAPFLRHEKRMRKGVDRGASESLYEAEKHKVRFGLTEKVFICCDAIKRMWRAVHLAMVSYWKGTSDNPGLEMCFRAAIDNPGYTYDCRRVKIRRDGAWLRIKLPSGRYLCYLNPSISDKDGSIWIAGFNQYTRQWTRIKTYGGKLFENIVQAAACDQLDHGMQLIEREGYPVVFHVHDEVVCEVPDTSDYTVDAAAEMLCSRFGWNEGVPLAAAGFETDRYYKPD